MTIPRNKGIRTRDFRVQLSKPLKIPELNDMRKQQGGSKEYGKSFIIKPVKAKEHGKMVKRYAIFIRERRKEKRAEVISIKNVKLSDLIMMKLPQKKEGITIFKELKDCKEIAI